MVDKDVYQLYYTMWMSNIPGNYAISRLKKYYDRLVVMLLLVVAISDTNINVRIILTEFGLGLSAMITYFAMLTMYKLYALVARLDISTKRK